MIAYMHYDGKPFFTDDYRRVRQFLIDINRDALVTPGYTWGRWEWMITHGELDQNALGHIGLWEEDGDLVAVATIDGQLGEGFLLTAPGYEELKGEMLTHAARHLAKEGHVRVAVGHGDQALQRLARKAGFVPTPEAQHTAMMVIPEVLDYTLPEGFTFTSKDKGWDFEAYHRCLWLGFDHPGQPTVNEETLAMRRRMLSSPMIDPALVVAVVAPDGQYAAHCGMWYWPGDTYAMVEPVATVPEHRRKGLGRAVVLEAMRRCRERGAQQALVGSNQAFYYALGFDPFYMDTWWQASAT